MLSRLASFTMSSMKINSQGGYVSGMLISLLLTIVLLLASIGFGVWAFAGRQDYKNNSDQKAAVAAEEAKKAAERAEAARYAEEAKNPLKTYKAPSQYGGVSVQYPKTWSGYVIEDGTRSQSVDGYFHQDVVPDVGSRSSTFGLRVQVVDQAYDKAVKAYDSKVNSGQLAAAPYEFPKVPGVIGMRFDGQVENDKQGSMIIVPMRNLTLRVWTESPNFLSDFNNIILPNLSFSP